MLGGDPADLDRLMPLFSAMGRNVHRMGPFGSGMAAKVLNNLLAASHTAMTRLALDWADAAGLDEAAFLALVHTSSGQNWLASNFDGIEFARDGFASDNTIGILVKDVAAALDAAPAGADTTLPRAVQQAVARLAPRTRRSD
jgi:3-hydroxyisobutyrate dehydrogenase-like beta-hydroxyacid dehydrogenase